MTDDEAREAGATIQVDGAQGEGGGQILRSSLALAMVNPEYAAVGTELEIKILDKIFKATILPESPYDADNVKLRG